MHSQWLNTGSNTPLVQLSTLDRHSLVRDSSHRGRQRCQRVLSICFCFTISVTLSPTLSQVACFQGTDIDSLFFSHKVLSFQETVASHLLFNISVWGVSGCCCYRVCYRDWGFSDLHEKQFVCSIEYLMIVGAQWWCSGQHCRLRFPAGAGSCSVDFACSPCCVRLPPTIQRNAR